MKKRVFFYAFFLFILSVCLSTVAEESTSSKVNIFFHYPENGGIIGQPFTVSYEISGGSGQYENIYYDIMGVTEHICIDSIYGELLDLKGEFTIIPTVGDYLELDIHCTDKATGIYWNAHAWEIPCSTNPSVPATLSGLPDACSIDEPFSFEYSIGGDYALNNATVEVWEFIKDDTYPDCMLEQPIETNSGTLSYTPKAGNQLYVALRGTNTNGQPFYVKTERITVEGSSSYLPVTIDFSYSSESVQIGKPFTVLYNITGGSGIYSDIYYYVMGVTEHVCLDSIDGELSGSNGSFTIVPTVGDYLEFDIHCVDTETGIYWNTHAWDIDCAPSSDIEVEFATVPQTVFINRPFTFEYTINSDFGIKEADIEIWEFIKDDTYPDRLFEQTITNKYGSLTYTPKAGSQLYIAIFGKDSRNQPFYVKTQRINIAGEDPLTNCLILPSSLKTIEEEAFSNVKATKVYIPEYVGFIDENAFANSNIMTVLGNSSVALDYAKNNGLEYIQFILED